MKRRARKRRTRTRKAIILSMILVLVVFLAGCLLQALNHKIQTALYPIEYREQVERYAEECNLPLDLVYAVIKTESGFRKGAVSSADARGLMQLTQPTMEWIAWRLGEDGEKDPFDPDTNIRYGCYYLAYLFERFGDWEAVYAAYNAGPGKVDEWLADPKVSENGRLVYIPYAETANYVKKVTRAREIYRDLYEETMK